MRQSVFVDTSAWYALADLGDRHHATAVRCVQGLLAERRTLITTNYVAGETYTLLRIRLGYVASQEFLRRIRRSALAQRVFVPEPWEEAAEDLLVRYDDQDLSYVDATSFVTMRRLSVHEAFAFDHHFAVLGFTLIGA